jgi:hypothetical protein
MGSTLAKSPRSHKGFLGGTIPEYVLYQFVHGVVVDVCTSDSSNSAFGRRENINSIIAYPHIHDSQDPMPKISQVGENYRYWPLLRGITEVPAKGDPILLCTFGGKNYYLGPLNTQNNPCLNKDNNPLNEIVHHNPGSSENIKKSENEIAGRSLNFRNSGHKRLSKQFNNLDLPEPVQTKNSKGEIDYQMIGKNAINENHGDMILEGRHGNSIRIGSRYINPYIILSNGRDRSNNQESLGDGSIISITNNGTLWEHFGDVAVAPGILQKGYDMSSNIFAKYRTIKDLAAYKWNQYDFEQLRPFLFGYSADQILITSGRLILDSKSDDLFISSIRDIYLGSGKNFLIATEEDLVVESRNIYLGKPTRPEESRDMNPMVLGNPLLEILQELVSVLMESKSISASTGTQIPLTDESGTPGSLKISLENIGKKLDKILSSYHFIEPNDRPEEPA